MDKIKKYKGYIDMVQSKIKDEVDRFMEMIDIHRDGLRKASKDIEAADDISVIEKIEDMASHDYKDLLEISKGYGEGRSKYNRMKFSHEEIYIKGSDWNPDPNFTEVARIQLKDTLEIYEALFKYIETRRREVTKKISITTIEIKENEIRRLFSKKLNIIEKGISVTPGDRLISDLKIMRPHVKDYARLAMVLYDSREIKTPVSFNKWLFEFYNLLNIEDKRQSTYKKKDAPDYVKLKSNYPYLF